MNKQSGDDFHDHVNKIHGEADGEGLTHGARADMVVVVAVFMVVVVMIHTARIHGLDRPAQSIIRTPFARYPSTQRPKKPFENSKSTSFFAKKEAKKLSFPAGCGDAGTKSQSQAKVFCFFFSRKKSFFTLSNSL